MNRTSKILNACRGQDEGDSNPDPVPNIVRNKKKIDNPSNGYLEVESFYNLEHDSKIQETRNVPMSHFWSNSKSSNWFCNRKLSSPMKSENVIENFSDTDIKVAYSSNEEEVNTKIIIHDIKILNPISGESPAMEVNVPFADAANIKNISFRSNESEYNISSKTLSEENVMSSPCTPEDPFHASSSEDSTYCPTSDEDSSDDELPSQRKDKKRKKCNDSKSNSAKSIEVVKTKTPYKRKPDHCYFCENKVFNFSRHILRNHPMEIEVAKITAKPIKSRERKQLFNALRRKGNYLADGGNCFKPVREGYVPEREKVPCSNCLGHFSSKLLYRHKKKCLERNTTGAENINLLSNLKVDRRLREEVFPRMRADKVSFEAQKDPLICEFGARYLKIHREKHFIHVTSRKMRELSKVLLEMRALETSINTFISALKPQFFDLFVEAVKRIAKYDSKQDVYLSPTFAINIATSLKQCCDIAITFIYTKNMSHSLSNATIEADLKTLIRLFESNWRFEISSHAANNLNLNKWNKVTIVPLASDLRLLRQHLIDLAKKSLEVLTKQVEDAKGNFGVDDVHSQVTIKDSVGLQAFNNLMETIYCRVILLNRKRSGELQRMYLNTYINAPSEMQKYEEFDSVVSLTEKILLKSLKRVVIRGKRGKGVPVLFHSDIQEHISIILKIRDYFVPNNNPYLFATANSNIHLIGYKVLSKHAKLCGAQNPSSISSTRLRKHLATLSQLFNLTDGEIEQLATFMGHTSGVHRNSYRLPDDVYQTAKISKLLMVMEKGGADHYKGKSIDDIDIDMEENLLNENNCGDNSDEDENDILDDIKNTSKASTSNSKLLNPRKDSAEEFVPKSKKKQMRTLVPWTSEQKDVTLEYFKDHIKSKKPPKRQECEELKEKNEEILHNKDWLKIKVFVQNTYTKGNKK